MRYLMIPWLIALAPQPAQAHIQDYQIRRLLAFGSECQVVSIALVSTSGSTVNYHAECDNVAFYPDGVDIACANSEDDRSCRVLTQAKHFTTPDLLSSGPAKR